MGRDGTGAAPGGSARAADELTDRERELLEAALDYVRAGLPVFPCHVPRQDVPGGCSCVPEGHVCSSGAKTAGKHPRTARGLHDATTEEDIVRAWWGGAWRGSNIAIVAPKWAVILDVDVGAGHGGVNGFQLLADLEDQHEELPDCPRTWTGSRGAHYLFRLPPGVSHGCRAGALPKGLDIRGGGQGYILAPPSVHASGNAYRWQVMRSIHDVEIPEIPSWLLAIIKRGERESTLTDDPFDVESLPTEVPERIKRVLAAARCGVRKVVRMPTGHVTSIVLSRCPACGDTRGKCHLTPSGRLRSKREADCPAGPRQAGDAGIALVEWVGRYAQGAVAALATQDGRKAYDRPEADRLAIALAELAMRHDADVGIGAWLWACGMCPDLRPVVHEAGMLVWGDAGDPDADDAAGCSRLARAVAGSQPDAEHALMGIRDMHGAVRVGAWVSAAGAMRPVGVRGLESAGDMPDGVVAFGDLPSAVAAGAAGRSVVVTVGPLDHLTAAGLVMSGVLDAETVGAPRPRDLVPLLTRMRREWAAAGAICPRVVLVLPSAAGAASEAAVRALDGRAGVAICSPTVRGGAPTSMLHASAADFGVESAARQIRTAPMVAPVPIDIQDAGEAMRDGLVRAVRESLMVTTHGRRRVVIVKVDPGVGKTTAMLRLSAEIASGVAPVAVPLNNRRRDSDDTPPEARRVGFWLASHPLADQKLAEATGRLGLASSAKWERLKGALEWCFFKDRVRLVYPVVGRRGICGDPESDDRCPEAEAGCQGAREPAIPFGAVAIGTHAMSPNVRQDLCVIDEDPGVLEDAVVKDFEIASLFASRILPRVARWRKTTNPQAGDAARLFSGVAAALADLHAQGVASGTLPPHARQVLGDELAQAIAACDPLLLALGTGFGEDAAEPPVPTPNELRAGAFSLAAYPSRAAFRALRELLSWWRRRDEKPAEALAVLGSVPRPPPPIASLEVRPDRTWALHIMRPRRLPDCPVVVLDATGDLAVDRWKAAFPDRDVRTVHMAVAGPPPAVAIHVRTDKMTRRAIFDRDGGMKADGVRRLRQCVLRASAASRKAAVAADAATAAVDATTPPGRPVTAPGGDPRRLSLGVLVYKRVHDLATGAAPPSNPDEHRIAALGGELAELGTDVTWGYFGRDDRATNRFEAVDALAVIGDPTINLGALEMQGHALDMQANEIGRSLAHATLIQAVFRARHTRPGSRSIVVLVAGRHAPHVAGVEWAVEPLPATGRPKSGAREIADAMVAHVALETGDVVGLRIVRWWEFSELDLGRGVQALVSDDDIRRACIEYAHTHSLQRVTSYPLSSKKQAPNVRQVVFAPGGAVASVFVDSWDLL